ncbi:hypothetical protein DFH06DRAFT_1348604 [Mycena polygramma]|nr:hypothetical protein DFH06DRAFT_1348604 [Mycena polygramma]
MPIYLCSHSPTTFYQLSLPSGWISLPTYSSYYLPPQPSPDDTPPPTSADYFAADRLPAMRIPAPSTTNRSATQNGEPYRFAMYSPGVAPEHDSHLVLDPSLIDANTGHEVQALPTHVHPDLPAAPRPGTPGPDRQLLEAHLPRLAPNLSAHFGDKETQAQYYPLHRAVVKERKAHELRAGVAAPSLNTQNTEAADVNKELGDAGDLFECKDDRTQDSLAASEEGQGLDPFFVGTNRYPLPSARHGPLFTREHYSSSSSGSSSDDSSSNTHHALSPILEDEQDEPFCSCFTYNVSPLPSPTWSEDDIPLLSDIDSDSDESLPYQVSAKSYFAVATLSSGPGHIFPFYRATGTLVMVEEAGLMSELEYIHHTPSPAVNPSERALDQVHMEGISYHHDQAIAEMEETEDEEVTIFLQHAAVIASCALSFLDEAAMEREERSAIEEGLDVLTVKMDDGTRRFHNSYGIPISLDGGRFHILSADAMMRQAMYRLSLRILALPHSALIAFIVDLRACRYNLGNLRFRTHIPPPYLLGCEYAHLQLIYYGFVDHEHFEVAEAINTILCLRFQELAVITHFLYGGLLEVYEHVPRLPSFFRVLRPFQIADTCV